MKLRLLSWMRGLDDASLKRLCDATAWNSDSFRQRRNALGKWTPDVPACMVCHATGNQYDSAFDKAYEKVADGFSREPMAAAEQRYMDYAERHGEEEAGRVFASLARGILARRNIAAQPKTDLQIAVRVGAQ